MESTNARESADKSIRPRRAILAALFVWAALMASCLASDEPEVFVSGLTNPRGVAFDGQGRLWIAEAGDRDTPGRIVRRNSDESLMTVVEGLPFTPGANSSGEDVGVSGLTFGGDVLYAVVGEGLQELSSSLIRIRPDGAMQLFASLWLDEALKGLGNQDSGTNPFDVAIHPESGRAYVVDSALNRVLLISESGDGFDVFVDLTDESGTGPVPTGLAFGPEARLHVAIFSRWPHPIGAGSVLRLDGSGKPLTVAADLTTPIDVTFDKSGRMYVLEFSSGFDQGTQPGFKPATGRVIRFDGAELRVVADGLNYPVSFAFGPRGDLYVSANAAFEGPGAGTVLRIPIRGDGG